MLLLLSCATVNEENFIDRIAETYCAVDTDCADADGMFEEGLPWGTADQWYERCVGDVQERFDPNCHYEQARAAECMGNAADLTCDVAWSWDGVCAEVYACP